MHKHLLNFDKQLHGIWRVIPSPVLTEIIAQSGCHFQILDCEHGAYDFNTLEADIRTCEIRNCLSIVRVSGLNNVEVQRCLDLGADGIIFPQLTKYEDFKKAISLMEYAPSGIRGYNPFVRANEYGVITNSAKKQNPPLCIPIIETLEAINHLDKILTLKSISALYIGSYDLSAQLGCIGQMDNPKLLKIVNSIIEKCNSFSKPVGLMVNDFTQYSVYKQKGVDFFVNKVDSYQIKNSFTEIFNQFNKNV
jgi:4-hydroxy-2-oxoheptanedioate aldolase